MKCNTCGELTDACYTDLGILGMVHGACQCRECYIKDGHPECPECKELTDKLWTFCAHCGHELKKEVMPGGEIVLEEAE